MLGNYLMLLLSSADFFHFFSLKKIRSVGPDLDLNCLQMSSADDKRRHQQGNSTVLLHGLIPQINLGIRIGSRSGA